MQTAPEGSGRPGRQPAVYPQIAGLLLAVSLILAIVVMVTVRRGGGAAEPLDPILLATGDWAPYSGETLPSSGLASAVVAAVFQQMGHQPQFRFMPWARAEQAALAEQTNSGVRGAFPYAFTAERGASFYYSQPLLEIRLAVYHSRKRNPGAAQIKTAKDLAGHAIVPISGYRYPAEAERHLARMPPAEDNVAAFRLLLKSQEPLLIVEAARVGEELLRDALPAEADEIGIAELTFRSPIHLIASRRNPENKRLIRDFDEVLARMRRDGSLERLQGEVLAALDERRMVRLHPVQGAGHIEAFELSNATSSWLLPLGTKAVVERWSENFLSSTATDARRWKRVQVRVLNGPQRGRLLYVDERALVLP
jgi:ABC-type amino acid transport substrate-binding protein